MKPRLTVILLLAGLAALPTAAQSVGPSSAPDRPGTEPSQKVASFTLADQYEKSHSLTFPGTNVVVLTLADQKGSKQIAGWVEPLKRRFGDRIQLAGVADVSKVPGFLRGRVRAGFREQMPYPIMLDWKGTVCRRLAIERNQANVLLLDPSGTIRLRLTGEAEPQALARLTNAITATFAIQGTSAITAAPQPLPAPGGPAVPSRNDHGP